MSSNHEWANPAPAGLLALAMACFTFFALLSGKVEYLTIPLLGCWLIGGFVIQIMLGILELRKVIQPVVMYYLFVPFFLC